MQDTRQREGYDEMLQKLLETLTPAERLAGLTPAERLTDLAPEEQILAVSDETLQKLLETLTPAERLAGLTPEDQILALSDEVLRGFSEEYVRSLPAHVQRVIRERLGTPR